MGRALPRPGRPQGAPAPRFPLFLALLLAACAPSRPGHPPSAPDPVPQRQIIYLIHGDADYVWHDRTGARRLADRDALVQAREVAARLPGAEVLIFHQTPRRHLWAHPSRDGVFYHYRGGRLLRAREYSRAGRGGGLRAEAELFRRHAAPAPPEVRVFAWFGHEIPLRPLPGYSRSHPREPFSLADLVRALERFAAAGRGSPSGKPYALIVLSACRGGVPAATSALFPYADHLVASPARLHLSHLDTRPLVPWLSRPDAGSPEAAREGSEALARASFAALAERTVTGVTLAAYESGQAAGYLAAHPGPWDDRGLTSYAGYRDCGDNPGFGQGGPEAGALVLHRPPRFGPGRGRRGHSGWECPAEVPGDPSGGTAGTGGGR